MEFLDTYQQLISTELNAHSLIGTPKELYDPINYILNLGGKRLRPMMVLMACDMFDGDLQKAMKPALAIEYFHNFSLMHDDIMDKAPLRRGKPTVHTKYDINTAILSGDALLIKSYQLFENLEPQLYKKSIELFSNTAVTLCEGQQYDMNFEKQKEVSYEEYIQMITYKTGVLGACAFQLGAMIANAPAEEAKKLYEFGKHLGIAFQLKDDYLDVFGNQETIGKIHAGDIFENKKTVLYILALQNAKEEQKKELLFWYGVQTENIDKVYGIEKIFRQLNVDTLTLQLIHKHNTKAREYLQDLQVASEKKEAFYELIDYLLTREN